MQSNVARLAERDDERFEIEQWLPHRFSWVANEVSRCLYGHYHSRWGLSVVGWRIVALLAARAPLSAKEVGELTGMEPVPVTRAVAQLVRLKLASRRTDPADRRRMALHLTATGRRVYDEMLPYMRRIEAALLDGIDASGRAQLSALLDQLMANGQRAFVTDEHGVVRLAPDPHPAPHTALKSRADASPPARARRPADRSPRTSSRPAGRRPR